MSDSESDEWCDQDYQIVDENVPSSAPARQGTPINVLTENDIVGYLQERFRNGELYWSPLMLRVLKHYTSLSQSEFKIGTIELLLNVPLQLNIVFNTFTIDLNKEDVIIPFDGRLFIDAKHFVRKMLEERFITLNDVRDRAKFLFQ